MLGDLKNVRLVALPNEYAIPMLLSQRLFYQNTGYEILSLGDFGENFLTSGNIRFDENFYLQAGIPFVLRWSNFSFERDKNREAELFNELGCGESDYIFLHEDTSRDYTGIRIIIIFLLVCHAFNWLPC